MASNDSKVRLFFVCASAHYKLLCNVPCFSYMNMHLPIVPCGGTKRTLFTNKLVVGFDILLMNYVLLVSESS